MTLLIVDDNISHRRLLKAMLEAEGFGILEAENGVQALKILESAEVACVISDILMPVMDGYRLCYEIRKNPKLQNIPYILFTATYDLNSEKNAKDFGADGFVTKPAATADIARIVREILAQKRTLPREEASLPTEFKVMREYSETLIRKLEERNVELSKQAEELTRINAEMQQFNRSAVGREQKMIELKRQVNELCKELGRVPPYDLSLLEEKKKG